MSIMDYQYEIDLELVEQRLAEVKAELDALSSNIGAALRPTAAGRQSPSKLRRVSLDRGNTNRLHRALSNFCLCRNAYMAAAEEADELHTQTDSRIGIWTDDERFVCRFPRIPCKQENEELPFALSAAPFYTWDLEAAARNRTKYPTAIYMADKYLMQFIHVYPTERAGELPDNDHYAYKHYIDLVADIMGRGDSGGACSLRYDTILRDDIPEGTYCIVSDIRAGTLAEETLAEIVKKSDIQEYGKPAQKFRVL